MILSYLEAPGAAWRRAATLGSLLLALNAGAASVEGQALYQQRILPPAGAVLVVTLVDSARADAPALELASARMRLASGPPFRYRLEYDERLVEPPARPTLRARIEVGDELWMSTGTLQPLSARPPVLLLHAARPAPAAAPASAAPEPADASARCGALETQAKMNQCADEEFQATQAAMAQALQRHEGKLTPVRRTAWRQIQRQWLAYRTEACRFETAAAAGGSLAPMLQALCAARMTRLHTAELERHASCPEGQAGCSGPAPGR